MRVNGNRQAQVAATASCAVASAAGVLIAVPGGLIP